MKDNHKDDGFLINKAMMIRKNENKIEDVYKISKKPIGTGAFGVVHTCVHKLTKQERAVKKISKKKIKNNDSF